jgi:hypothetical protein
VGFEPTIPVFELAKTFHALDGTATVIGLAEDKIVNCFHAVSIKVFKFSYKVPGMSV